MGSRAAVMCVASGIGVFLEALYFCCRNDHFGLLIKTSCDKKRDTCKETQRREPIDVPYDRETEDKRECADVEPEGRVFWKLDVFVEGRLRLNARRFRKLASLRQSSR